MEPLLCYPDPPPTWISQTLAAEDLPWRSTVDPAEAANTAPPGGWAMALVAFGRDPTAALAFCRALKEESADTPLVAIVASWHLDYLEKSSGIFDDFCLEGASSSELVARIRLRLKQSGAGESHTIIQQGALLLNLDTYQAAIDGRPLDLTYMEYELLRFLAARPGKVFTREALLNQVWGYDYYGGARTVDVHVRRLRAKLGEEHAHLIQTVRSVGYRFGQSRWLS